MLRIEEIVGAMDDEFRYALDALDSDRLTALAEDKAALRRLRPVGVSNAEAVAMIAAILERRAAEPPPKPRPARRRTRKKKPASSEPPEAEPETRPEAEPAAPPEAEPETRPEAEPAAPPARPACLPAPPLPALLMPPAAFGPAIRLGPPPEATPAIAMPAPLAPPSPPQRRWWLVVVLLAVAAGVLLLL